MYDLMRGQFISYWQIIIFWSEMLLILTVFDDKIVLSLNDHHKLQAYSSMGHGAYNL